MIDLHKIAVNTAKIINPILDTELGGNLNIFTTTFHLMRAHLVSQCHMASKKCPTNPTIIAPMRPESHHDRPFPYRHADRNGKSTGADFGGFVVRDF